MNYYFQGPLTPTEEGALRVFGTFATTLSSLARAQLPDRADHPHDDDALAPFIHGCDLSWLALEGSRVGECAAY
jgi:hypothetical protein